MATDAPVTQQSSSTANVANNEAQSPAWWNPDETASQRNTDQQPSRSQTPSANANTSSNGVAPTRSSVPVACIQCRARHLKCDGGTICKRCRTEGVACSYVKSRRGWKGPRKAKVQAAHAAHAAQVAQAVAAQRDQVSSSAATGISTPGVSPEVSGSTALSSITSPLLSGSDTSSPSFEFTSADMALLGQQLTIGSTTSSISIGPVLSSDINTPLTLTTLNSQSRGHSPMPPAGVTGAFMYYFFASHPFLLPRARLLELFKKKRMPQLELAMQFIGSCYIPAAPTGLYKEALNRALFHNNPPKDGFTVQALLLFAIGLHANDEPERALQVMQVCITMALDIGMNRADFAIRSGAGIKELEESWRRTWWEIYVTDGMLAGVNQSPFHLWNVAMDVPLPCEEMEYLSGHIPPPKTLQDYDDSAFAGEDLIFSSYTYRIDAVRILGRILALAQAEYLDFVEADMVDTALVNWSLHLPAAKKELVAKDGHIDEILFQAHMIHNASSIMLHRPRSNLGFGEVEAVRTCVVPGQSLAPTQTREFHTAKAMESAEEISKLIRLPSPIVKRTPFFICCVTMASVAHLSFWSWFVPDGEDAAIKELIRLDTGVLRTFSSLWPVAQSVLRQVQGVAHELFTSKRALRIHLWQNMAAEDVLQGLIEDGASNQLGFTDMLQPIGSQP